MPRFSLQTYAPPLVTAALLALTAALGTHFVLKTLYGVPAPAPSEPIAAPASVAAPAWLAGGNAAQASELTLLGVVAQSADGKRGLALLQLTGSDRAKVYSVGQTLPNGAVLQSVAARSVTVDAQGSLQTVLLDAKTNATTVAVNAQRGSVGMEAGFAVGASAMQPSAVPNPMVNNAASVAAAARMATKRLRAAPSASEPQGEAGLQQP